MTGDAFDDLGRRRHPHDSDGDLGGIGQSQCSLRKWRFIHQPLEVDRRPTEDGNALSEHRLRSALETPLDEPLTTRGFAEQVTSGQHGACGLESSGTRDLEQIDRAHSARGSSTTDPLGFNADNTL